MCCVARRDIDLIEVEKSPAFRPLSRTSAQVLSLSIYMFLDLPILLFCAVVSATMFAERVS